jgi:thiol:disulfide interchange protein
MAVVCGLAWWLIKSLIPFFYLNIVLAGAAGYVIGEVISFSVNRKRGLGLAVISGAALVLAYFVSLWGLFGFYFPALGFGLLLDIAGVAFGVFIAINRFRR